MQHTAYVQTRLVYGIARKCKVQLRAQLTLGRFYQIRADGPSSTKAQMGLIIQLANTGKTSRADDTQRYACCLLCPFSTSAGVEKTVTVIVQEQIAAFSLYQ